MVADRQMPVSYAIALPICSPACHFSLNNLCAFFRSPDNAIFIIAILYVLKYFLSAGIQYDSVNHLSYRRELLFDTLNIAFFTNNYIKKSQLNLFVINCLLLPVHLFYGFCFCFDR